MYLKSYFNSNVVNYYIFITYNLSCIICNYTHLYIIYIYSIDLRLRDSFNFIVLIFYESEHE